MTPDFAIPGLMPIGSPVYSGAAPVRSLRILRGIPWFDSWRISVDGVSSLAGCAVRAEARRCAGGELVFDLAPTIIDETQFMLGFVMDAEDTALLPLGIFYTDVLLDRADGSTSVVYQNLPVSVEELLTQPPI